MQIKKNHYKIKNLIKIIIKLVIKLNQIKSNYNNNKIIKNKMIKIYKVKVKVIKILKNLIKMQTKIILIITFNYNNDSI